jgi:hypothetical protein
MRDITVLGYRALRRSHSMARYSIHAALNAFVEAVRRGSPFAPGWDEAVRNMRGLEAAQRSARLGKPVPLEPAP